MAWDNGHSRTSAAEWKRLRTWAKTNLDYTCQHAHHSPCQGNLELDHKTPHMAGGTNHPNNLQWLCNKHHKQKTAEESRRARGGNYIRNPRPPIGKT